MPQVPETRSRSSHQPREPVDIPSNQFQVRDIQASFYKLIGEVGGVASSAITPMSSQKKLINEFLRLIYDHKSTLIDTVKLWYR
jgi:hypothetical protein